MFDLFRLWVGTILRIFRTQRSLVLENLVLRQQLVVLKRKHPRPRLGPLDKLFWLAFRRFWPQWKEALVIVLPDTVVRVASIRFQTVLDNALQSAKTRGWWTEDFKRLRGLIFQMVAEESHLGCASHSWGTPHAGLRCIGDDDLPLDETGTQASRARPTLAGLFT